MAENLEKTTTTEIENQNIESAENTPSVDELMAELAKERAEKAKLKNSFDTASSELAATKKQLRTKMTAEEQIEEEKRLADEAKDAKIQELESKFRTMDYSKRYMGIGMDEKTSEAMAEITGELDDPDKFFSALGKFVQGLEKKTKENSIQEFIKSRPDIKAGSGNTDKNAWVSDMVKEIAQQKSGANKSILEKYM